MIAIFYAINEFGVPSSTIGLLVWCVVVAIAGLISLGALLVLILDWKQMTSKSRFDMAMMALFL